MPDNWPNWVDICGGLYEIDRAYEQTTAGVFKFRCNKCGMYRKEVMVKMPPHPRPEHPDSAVYAAAMVEYGQ